MRRERIDCPLQRGSQACALADGMGQRRLTSQQQRAELAAEASHRAGVAEGGALAQSDQLPAYLANREPRGPVDVRALAHALLHIGGWAEGRGG